MSIITNAQFNHHVTSEEDIIINKVKLNAEFRNRTVGGVLVLTKAEFVPLIFDENQTTIDEEAYECDCDKLFVLRKSLLTHRRLTHENINKVT